MFLETKKIDDLIYRAIDNDHTAAMKPNGKRKHKKKAKSCPSTSKAGSYGCDKVLKNNHIYRKHLPAHSDKHIMCPLCGKSFAYKSNLQVHLTTHSKCHPCSFCHKTFKQKSSLEQHLKLHATRKTYSCKWCDKSFFQQEHLKAHVRNHTNERPFVCEICCKSFNIKSSLQRHMNCHTGIKPFTCDICKRGYTRRSVLVLHIQQVHENIKPFQCNVCFLNFSQKGNLKAHIRRKHLYPDSDKRSRGKDSMKNRRGRKQVPKTSRSYKSCTTKSFLPAPAYPNYQQQLEGNDLYIDNSNLHNYASKVFKVENKNTNMNKIAIKLEPSNEEGENLTWMNSAYINNGNVVISEYPVEPLHIISSDDDTLSSDSSDSDDYEYVMPNKKRSKKHPKSPKQGKSKVSQNFLPAKSDADIQRQSFDSVAAQNSILHNYAVKASSVHNGSSNIHANNIKPSNTDCMEYWVVPANVNGSILDEPQTIVGIPNGYNSSPKTVVHNKVLANKKQNTKSSKHNKSNTSKNSLTVKSHPGIKKESSNNITVQNFNLHDYASNGATQVAVKLETSNAKDWMRPAYSNSDISALLLDEVLCLRNDYNESISNGDLEGVKCNKKPVKKKKSKNHGHKSSKKNSHFELQPVDVDNQMHDYTSEARNVDNINMEPPDITNMVNEISDGLICDTKQINSIAIKTEPPDAEAWIDPECDISTLYNFSDEVMCVRNDYETSSGILQNENENQDSKHSITQSSQATSQQPERDNVYIENSILHNYEVHVDYNTQVKIEPPDEIDMNGATGNVLDCDMKSFNGTAVKTETPDAEDWIDTTCLDAGISDEILEILCVRNDYENLINCLSQSDEGKTVINGVTIKTEPPDPDDWMNPTVSGGIDQKSTVDILSEPSSSGIPNLKISNILEAPNIDSFDMLLDENKSWDEYLEVAAKQMNEPIAQDNLNDLSCNPKNLPHLETSADTANVLLGSNLYGMFPATSNPRIIPFDIFNKTSESQEIIIPNFFGKNSVVQNTPDAKVKHKHGRLGPSQVSIHGTHIKTF